MTRVHRFVAPTSDAMAALGEGLGRGSSGGDVLVLIGDLGAGKTTLAQGIARGMGIHEAVTSPTFVIARTHRHPGAGPDLVHVDAYRLGSTLELDDLDLETDLDSSVVVVEWGEGLVDHLSAQRLDIRIERSDAEADETRQIEISATSPRWDEYLDRLVRVGVRT